MVWILSSIGTGMGEGCYSLERRKQNMGGVVTETKHFFKVMMPGFNEKLNLPKKLYNKLSQEKSEQAVLKTCLGTCKIRVCRNQELGLISFGDGWPDFVKRHDLCIGDFVVFEHIGNFNFNAFVFDESACEKDYFPIDPKEEPQEMPQSEVDYFQVNPKEDTIEAPKSKQKEESSGISILFESKHPFFNMRMNRRNRNAYIPAAFWKLNGLRSKGHILLRDPRGRKWPVRLSFFEKSRGRCIICIMGKGWGRFYKGNKLKVGDICGFELIPNNSNNIVLDVHIFPAVPCVVNV